MKKSLVLMFICSFVLSVTAIASAQQWDAATVKQCMEWKDMAAAKKEMPMSLTGVKIIGGAEIKKWMDEKKPFVLTDNRVKEQYDSEKIVGAKWLLADHMLADPKLLDQFKKDEAIVFYCNGILCWRSPAAALMFQKAGFTNLYWYREGLPEWKTLKYPTD